MAEQKVKVTREGLSCHCLLEDGGTTQDGMMVTSRSKGSPQLTADPEMGTSHLKPQENRYGFKLLKLKKYILKTTKVWLLSLKAG